MTWGNSIVIVNQIKRCIIFLNGGNPARKGYFDEMIARYEKIANNAGHVHN